MLTCRNCKVRLIRGFKTVVRGKDPLITPTYKCMACGRLYEPAWASNQDFRRIEEIVGTKLGRGPYNKQIIRQLESKPVSLIASFGVWDRDSGEIIHMSGDTLEAKQARYY